MAGILTVDDAFVGQRFELLTRNLGTKTPALAADATTLLATTDPLLASSLYDDFQSGGETIRPTGAELHPGLGNTGWLGSFVNANGSVDTWSPTVATPQAGAIGVGQLSTAGDGSISSLCRGFAPDDVVCRVDRIRVLEYVFQLVAQDSTTSGLQHFFGLMDNFAVSAFTGSMGILRRRDSDTNWILRRTGEADFDTGVSNASSTFAVRFTQNQDGTTLLGDGTWNLAIATPASPSLDVPVVSNFAGGTYGGVVSNFINFGVWSRKAAAAGVQAETHVDWIGFEPFTQTLAQRLGV